MGIKGFLELLLKRIWIIVVVTVVSTLGSMYVNISNKVVTYQAESTLYIMTKNYTDTNANINGDDITVSKQMIKDYAELLKSKKVMSAAIQELGFQNMSVDDLASKVGINLVNDSNVLKVTAVDTNPTTAMNIANVVSKVFVNKMNELTNEDNIGIVDKAVRPTVPLPTDTKKNIILSFIAGLFGSIAVIYLFDQLDTTIRKPEEIEKEFGITVLGIIPMKDIR